MALKIKQKAGIMILMRAAARQCAIAIKGPVPNSVPGLLAGLREVVGNCPAFDPHANQFVGVRLGSPRSAAGAAPAVLGTPLALVVSRGGSAPRITHPSLPKSTEKNTLAPIFLLYPHK